MLTTGALSPETYSTGGHHAGHRNLASGHTVIHQKCPRRSLPRERCCSLRDVLYPASRFQAGAPATSGIRQCVARRFTNPAERPRGVWLSAVAERPTSRTWWLEPHRAESLETSRAVLPCSRAPASTFETRWKAVPADGRFRLKTRTATRSSCLNHRDRCDDRQVQGSMADRSSRVSRSGSARMSISTTLPPAIVKPITESRRPSGRRETTPMLPFTRTT